MSVEPKVYQSVYGEVAKKVTSKKNDQRGPTPGIPKVPQGWGYATNKRLFFIERRKCESRSRLIYP